MNFIPLDILYIQLGTVVKHTDIVELLCLFKKPVDAINIEYCQLAVWNFRSIIFLILQCHYLSSFFRNSINSGFSLISQNYDYSASLL